MGAQGSQSGIAIRPESVWGVLDPGIFEGVNFTEEDMSFGIKNEISKNVRPDRQTADLVQVGAECSGGFNTEFQATNLDSMLPAFFWAAGWEADTPAVGSQTIKNGVTKSSFSIERANNDVSQFFLYTGMVPNTIEMTLEAGSPVICNVDFVGKEEQLNQVQWGTGNPTPAPVTPIMSSVSSVGSIKIDSVPLESCLIQKASWKLDNKVEGKTGVAVLGNCNADGKSIELTGSLSLYFNDQTYYQKYLNSTAFSLEFTLIDSAGNTYVIELAKCKFDEATANVTGKDDDVMMECSIVGIVGDAGHTISMIRTLV